VGLVEMEKQKRPRRPDRVQPFLGDRLRYRAVPLHLTDAKTHLTRPGRHVAVEEIEPLRDARLLAQHIGGDDPAGGKAPVAEHLREQPFPWFYGEADVVPDARFKWQAAREQRRVSRQRLRRMGVRALEDHTVGGQGVNDRSFHLLVAVRGQVIRPQRVDRDDDDRSADRR